MLLSQAADAGGGGLAGRVLGRAEGGADRGVGHVVGVAEDDGGPLGGRQLAGQVLELGVGGAARELADSSSSTVGFSRRTASTETLRAIVSTHARRCSPCWSAA